MGTCRRFAEISWCEQFQICKSRIRNGVAGSLTTRLTSPTGRQSSSGSYGLSSNTSLAVNAEEGTWQVQTLGQYYCGCIHMVVGFGGGITSSPMVQVGTSRSCWEWTGQLDVDP